jgi:hypothetical protein
MQNWMAFFFLGELEHQCGLFERAKLGLTHALARNSAGECWLFLDTLVLAAGNISKILWPARSKSKQRGRDLRDMLGVSDDSVLCSRDLRDHLEHFDERLERHATENCTVVDSNIGDLTMVSVGNALFLRNYDPRKEEVTFLNETYQLAPLVSAVCQLRSSIASAQSKLQGR